MGNLKKSDLERCCNLVIGERHDGAEKVEEVENRDRQCLCGIMIFGFVMDARSSECMYCKSARLYKLSFITVIVLLSCIFFIRHRATLVRSLCIKNSLVRLSVKGALSAMLLKCMLLI